MGTCPQCGKRPSEVGVKVFTQWSASGSDLCPKCHRGWNGATGPAIKSQPRCGGCGKNIAKAGVCQGCADHGVSAPTLFDGVGA